MAQAWTLDVEMPFYVFLPLFALWLVRARTVRTAFFAVAGVVVLSVAWKVVALGAFTDAATPESAPWKYRCPRNSTTWAWGC